MSFVIVHKDWGIFLGQFLGLAFWTELDPAGQECAVAFEWGDEAVKYIKTWDNPPPIEHFHFVPVKTEHKRYATIAECVRAGLPSWIP